MGNERRDGSNIDAVSFSQRFILLAAMVTVCDHNEHIFGLSSTKVMITEIDGQPLFDFLSELKIIPSLDKVKEKQVTSETQAEVFDT